MLLWHPEHPDFGCVVWAQRIDPQKQAQMDHVFYQLVSETTLRIRRGGPGLVASPTRQPKKPHW